MWQPQYKYIDIIPNGCGIYTITNLVNSKMYVGLATNFTDRRCSHWEELRKGKHGNDHLQNAFNSYGENNFKFEILVECEEQFLYSEENYWCNMLDTHNRDKGYNIQSTNPYGKTRNSKETRNKISKALKGRKMSEEQKAHLSKINKGKPITEEHRQKLIQSAKRKRSPLSQEHKEKLRIVKVGKKHSPEFIEKRISKIRGIPRTNEWKSLMSNKMQGNQNSLNTGKIVVQSSLSGEFIKQWINLRTCSKEVSICESVLSIVCRGKRKHKIEKPNQYRGFLWEFKNSVNN